MEPKFGQKRPKSGSKLGLLAIFFKFGSLVFLENASRDSLQQYIASSRDKSQKSKKKKKLEQNVGQSGPKSRLKLVVCHFMKFGSLAFL